MSETPQAGTSPLSVEVSFAHSPTLGKLADALAKAQLAFKPVIKDSENPYFKSSYADLATIIAATKEGLSKNGLAVIQAPGRVMDNKVELISMLVHSSDEWIRATLFMPMSKADAQGIGSALTYGRRYSYQSLVSVAGESDDDAASAVGMTQKDARGSSTDKSDKDGRNINPTQQRAFWAATTQGKKSKERVADYLVANFGIKSSSDIPKSKLDEAMKWAVSVESDELFGDQSKCFKHGIFSGPECPQCLAEVP